MMNTFLAGLVVLGLAAAPAFSRSTADHRGKSRPNDGHAARRSDETFVIKAASGGMAEVELREARGREGASDEVKKFGQRMVDDHSKAGDELKTLAQNKHITLPAGIDPQEKALHDRLAALVRARRSTAPTCRR